MAQVMEFMSNHPLSSDGGAQMTSLGWVVVCGALGCFVLGMACAVRLLREPV